MSVPHHLRRHMEVAASMCCYFLLVNMIVSYIGLYVKINIGLYRNFVERQGESFYAGEKTDDGCTEEGNP